MNQTSFSRRIIQSASIFFGTFFLALFIGQYFLSEGFLREYNTGGNITFSSNLFFSILQIFLFNLLSILAIIVANLFSKRKTAEQAYRGSGFLVLFVLGTIFGLTLGSNSFGVVRENAVLSQKLFDLFKLTQYSDLWEFSALILVNSVTIDKGILLTTGKKTHVRSFREISYSSAELKMLSLAFLFLLVGAVVESRLLTK
ncbi:Uncharacterised protein [Enterococcus durans]|uniref:hypothetical protein n=1 Tax=Enterococcus durans TaxID=53345 RepID=UPI000DFF631F|nr:hypothetical protein [Enterococcus durans]STP39227.1 Uncharacterised protein [Enterococcus durans]